MTVQRLYSLPNCSLFLEGMGEMISLTPTDARVPMATLINVECRLAGEEKPLSGGREFLDNLAAAVSQYTQALLSGLNVKATSKVNTGLVQLEQVNDTVHRLKVTPQEGDNHGVAAREILLNTVQLFDLVEALDQLLADSQTLPDLKLNLKPLARREVAKEKAGPSQVLPGAIGVASLAAAAVALALLPTPKVQQPQDLYPVRTGETATGNQPKASASPSPSPNQASPTASPSPGASPDLTTLAANLGNANEITDTEELNALRQELRTKLENAWGDRAANTQDLTYQVGVDKDGTIRGYKPLNSVSAEKASATPLLDLLPRTTEAAGAMGLFKVVFTGSGNVDVASWREVMTSPISGVTEITSTAELNAILPKLRSAINQNWDKDASFNEELIFKVRVKPDGSIFDYNPENDAAARFVDQTPLPKLGKPVDAAQTAPIDTPIAIFKVVMTPPDGALEINPWRGWQD